MFTFSEKNLWMEIKKKTVWMSDNRMIHFFSMRIFDSSEKEKNTLSYDFIPGNQFFKIDHQEINIKINRITKRQFLKLQCFKFKTFSSTNQIFI